MAPMSTWQRQDGNEAELFFAPPVPARVNRLVCPTCRREILDTDSVCGHCLQPLIPTRSASGHSLRRMNAVAENFVAAKVFWVVFFIGMTMAMVLGFPEWFFAVKPETQQLGLMKMGYGAGAALLFASIGFAVTRSQRRGD